jgi:hypothetical protein
MKTLLARAFDSERRLQCKASAVRHQLHGVGPDSATKTWETDTSTDTSEGFLKSQCPSLCVLLARPQVLRYGQLANLFAHGRADFRGGAVVYTVVDTRLRYLLHEVVDLRPAPRRAFGGGGDWLWQDFTRVVSFSLIAFSTRCTR